MRARLFLALLLTTLPAMAAAQTAPRAFDVVVYGGTAGGVVTAIAAAREGARVALLEPRDHIGGMASGIGQAAGVAAKMVIDAGVAVQAIDTAALSAKLRRQGAVFDRPPVD